jgi:hypothetical protein
VYIPVIVVFLSSSSNSVVLTVKKWGKKGMKGENGWREQWLHFGMEI